jgi:hypothetical protein
MMIGVLVAHIGQKASIGEKICLVFLSSNIQLCCSAAISKYGTWLQFFARRMFLCLRTRFSNSDATNETGACDYEPTPAVVVQ